MRYFVFLLLFVSFAFAIPMDILEEKETTAGGEHHFGEFTATYDCDSKTIIIHIVSDPDEQPVEGAGVFLFYEERFTPILDSGVTDSDGDYTYVLIGDPEKMANLFMFTVEKTNFRTKEGHFLLPLGECAEPEEVEEPEPEPEPEPEEIEEPEEVEEPEEIEEPEPEPVENVTEDEGIYVPMENETEDAGEPLQVCPFSLVLLLLLFFRSVA